MTDDFIPQDEALAHRVAPPQLELIVGRLGPLAAMGLSSRRTLALLAPGAEEKASASGASGLMELAAWDPAIAANILTAAAKIGDAKNGDATLFSSVENRVVSPLLAGSIAEAMDSLGPQTVRTLALGALGRRWPGGAQSAGPWNRQEFWRHCIAVARAAEMLAQEAALPLAPDEARTWGLLHDLGKLGMLQAMPKSLLRLLEALSAEGGGDLSAREQEGLGVDHALFGRRMAQRWRFSEELQEVI